MNEIKQQIQSLFRLSETDTDAFLSGFSKIQLKKHDRFVESGIICNKVGLIESGLMMCVYLKNGNQIIEEFAYENHFITNYYSFLTQTPSAKEIVCLENCTIWVTSKPRLEQLSKEHAFIGEMARIMNEKLFLRTHDRVKSLLTDTPTERYQTLIQQRPDLIQRIPQYLMAAYLNVKPETVSRIRRKIVQNRFLDSSQ